MPTGTMRIGSAAALAGSMSHPLLQSPRIGGQITASSSSSRSSSGLSAAGKTGSLHLKSTGQNGSSSSSPGFAAAALLGFLLPLMMSGMEHTTATTGATAAEAGMTFARMQLSLR
jgi:hypothetical protein